MIEMTRHVHTIIRYDGPALSGHEMDVQDLAPALLALANIAQIANQRFNGDRALMRVLVNADVEQKCFQLDLSLVQSWMDQAQTLLGKDNIATAEQIAGYIGLGGGAGGGLLGLFKWLYGRKDRAASVTYTASDLTGVTIVKVIGDSNHITVANQTALLAQDPRILGNIKTVLAPLDKAGYIDFSVHHGDEEIVFIDKEEAEQIRSHVAPLTLPGQTPPYVSLVDGQVEIHTAQFKGTAQWGLGWTGRVRAMKIEDVDWLARYQSAQVPEAVPGAWLDVTMEITQPRDRTQPASFSIKKVKGVFAPEPPQIRMF